MWPPVQTPKFSSSGDIVRTKKAEDVFDSDNFSNQDRNVANIKMKKQDEYRGYVATPGGEKKGYNPKNQQDYGLKDE